MNSNPCIPSKRLALRPLSYRDADEAFQCLTRTLTRFLEWESPTSRRIFTALWRKWLISNTQGADWTFTIRSAEDKRFLGMAGLYAATTPTPELGLWIREDAQRHGYGSEAARCLHAWASQRLRPQHFICAVASENHASRRVVTQLGGRLRFVQSMPNYLQLVYCVPVAEGDTDTPYALQCDIDVDNVSAISSCT